MARALFTEVRECRLGDPEGSEKIGLELGAGILFADLLDEAEVAVAGVVDDDVEPAEMVVRLLDRGEVGRAIVDVERDREDGVAVLRHEFVERSRIAGGGGNAVATLKGGDRPFAAEAP